MSLFSQSMLNIFLASITITGALVIGTLAVAVGLSDFYAGCLTQMTLPILNFTVGTWVLLMTFLSLTALVMMRAKPVPKYFLVVYALGLFFSIYAIVPATILTGVYYPFVVNDDHQHMCRSSSAWVSVILTVMIWVLFPLAVWLLSKLFCLVSNDHLPRLPPAIGDESQIGSGPRGPDAFISMAP